MTLTDRLEAFLKARPNTWLFRKELDDLIPGGGYRQEVTRCRKRGMTILCEKREYEPYGRKVSFYRYVPKGQAQLFAEAS
jgi:hypothetical protein